MTTETIQIQRGELVLYQIFDFAEELNLEQAQNILQDKRSRGRLEQVPPDEIIFPKPPLCYSLGTHPLSLAQGEHSISVEAHLFHTGNLCIAVWLPIPPQMPLRELLAFSLEVENAKSLHALIEKEAKRIIGILQAASVRTREGYREDYTVFVLNELSRQCTEDADKELLTSLLLRERGNRRLSKKTVDEAFQRSLSYFQDDLVLIDWDSAIVIDPDAGVISAILELATVQLLELRYYETEIDKKLAKIYEELREQKGLHSNLLWGSQGQQLRSLLLTSLELSEHSDRIENSLKLIGDSYYSRVYNLAAEQFELSRYLSSLAQKSTTSREVSAMVNAETEAARSLILEILVVLLIVTEIVMAFVGGH